MKVKEKVSEISKTISNKDLLFFWGKIFLSFSGGILCAVPYFLGSFSPFAASLPAAITSPFSISCALGSIFGIFVFQSGISAFRYFATVLTSSAILHICLNYLGIKNEKLFRLLCPGICSAMVNLVFLFSQKFSVDLLFSSVAETTVTVLSVHLFSSAFKNLFPMDLSNDILNEKQLVQMILTFCIFSSQLRGTGSIGSFCSVFFFISIILFFSLKNMFFACASAGICSAFVMSMGDRADFLSPCIALCSCICPLMKNKPRFIMGVTCVTVCFAGCFFGEYTDFFPTFSAVVLAVTTVLLIPSKFLCNEKSHDPRSAIDNIAVPIRAKEISAAVENLGDCVNTVRKTLRPIVTADLAQVLFNAGEKVCLKCDLKDSCINSMRKATNPYYGKIALALKENRVDFSSFPENFQKTCYMSTDMLNSMKQAYFVYCTNLNTNNRINRFQEITGNQLKNVGSIIAPLCAAAVNAGAVSTINSRSCALCAEDFGIETISAHLCTDKADHEYFNLSFKKPENNFNVTKLTEKLCKETGYELDFPTLVQKDNIYTLIFRQKPKIGFKISAAAKAATPDGVSGDYYRSFRDSFSRTVVLLSDGMGTGTRAAIDSAFTCETFCNLLKSGLDIKTAASAVNCAMLMKSTDESLSTVDMVIADPITAKLQIFKCGAAPSFILKNGKVSVLEADSTPIGILDKVDMATSETEVSAGDVFLLVSDGVAGDSWGWISAELSNFCAESPSSIAKHILQCACDRYLGKRADDMTVIAIMVEYP